MTHGEEAKRRQTVARHVLCTNITEHFLTVDLFVCLQADGYIRDGGQCSEQCSQQPGLPPQTAEKERHQILHRTTVWEERKG